MNLPSQVSNSTGQAARAQPSINPLRILTVIESLGRGGAEQVLVSSLSALQARGHVCEVAALWPPYDIAPELRAAGIKVHELNLRHRWNIAAGITKIAALCRRRHYDVLHAHLFFAGLYVALSKAALPRPRRAISFHSVDYDRYPALTPQTKARKMLHRQLMLRAIDGHAAVTSVVARHYEQHLGLKQVQVIPNCFDTDQLRPDPALQRSGVLRNVGADPDRFVAVMVARLVPAKGHHFFLEALQLLRERGLRPQALLLGGGPLAAEIARQVAALGLQDQVLLCGPTPHREVVALIQAADALVLSSTHEGFGLAPAEAMLLERAVLATDIPAVRDVVQHEVTGLLVPPSDPPALAVGLERLMHDPALRERLGRAGRKSVIENFSATRIAERWEQFYRDLL